MNEAEEEQKANGNLKVNEGNEDSLEGDRIEKEYLDSQLEQEQLNEQIEMLENEDNPEGAQNHQQDEEFEQLPPSSDEQLDGPPLILVEDNPDPISKEDQTEFKQATEPDDIDEDNIVFDSEAPIKGDNSKASMQNLETVKTMESQFLRISPILEQSKQMRSNVFSEGRGIVPPQNSSKEVFADNLQENTSNNRVFKYQELEQFLGQQAIIKKNLVYPSPLKDSENDNGKFISSSQPKQKMFSQFNIDPIIDESQFQRKGESDEHNVEERGRVPSDITIQSGDIEVKQQRTGNTKPNNNHNQTEEYYDSKRFTNLREQSPEVQESQEIPEDIESTSKNNLNRYFTEQVSQAGGGSSFKARISQTSMATVESKDTVEQSSNGLPNKQIQKLVSEQVELAIKSKQQPTTSQVLAKNEALFRNIIQEEFRNFINAGGIAAIPINEQEHIKKQTNILASSNIQTNNNNKSTQQPSRVEEKSVAQSQKVNANQNSSQHLKEISFQVPPSNQKHQTSHKDQSIQFSNPNSSHRLPSPTSPTRTTPQLRDTPPFPQQVQQSKHYLKEEYTSAIQSHQRIGSQATGSYQEQFQAFKQQDKKQAFNNNNEHDEIVNQRAKQLDTLQSSGRWINNPMLGEISFSANNRGQSIQHNKDSIISDSLGSLEQINFPSNQLISKRQASAQFREPTLQNSVQSTLQQTRSQQQQFDLMKNDTILFEKNADYNNDQANFRGHRQNYIRNQQGMQIYNQTDRQTPKAHLQGFQDLIVRPPVRKYSPEYNVVEQSIDDFNGFLNNDSARTIQAGKKDNNKEQVGESVSKIWEQALDFFERGLLNRAYQLILDLEDDVYLLRLMSISKPCFKKLNSNVGKKLIRRINKIMESQFMDSLGIDIFSKAHELNLISQLNLEDSQGVKEILFDISASPQLGQAAATLYNLIEESEQS